MSPYMQLPLDPPSLWVGVKNSWASHPSPESPQIHSKKTARATQRQHGFAKKTAERAPETRNLLYA